VRPTQLGAPGSAIAVPSRALEPQPEARRLRDAAAPRPTASAPSNGHAAPAAPKPVAAPTADSAEPPSTEQFTDDLLRVISERTGYPIDMLDKDVPLEAGLGIDSIKTVEVFSKLKPYHAYFQRPDQDEEEVLKVFTRLKTLRDIINLYDELRLQHAPAGAERLTLDVKAKPVASANGSSVKRFELEAVEAVAEGDEKKNHLNTTL
jgi:hypothetical protein